MKYNIPGGKMNRGLSVGDTLTIISDPSAAAAKDAVILGWLVEWLQGFFLVADDVMDESDLRRGRSCWHRLVGKTAINDALLLQSFLFVLLKHYFGDRSFYSSLLAEFLDVTLKTELGQFLDLTGARMIHSDRFDLIAKYKTAFYSFVLPVKLAHVLAGMDLPERVEAELCELGIFFQVQDDYLDVYGDPAITGKLGTDIEEGKCTWLAVKFMQVADAHDLDVFNEHYGKNPLVIRRLYEKHSIHVQYQKYHDQQRHAFISKNGDNQVLMRFAEKIFNRRQ